MCYAYMPSYSSTFRPAGSYRAKVCHYPCCSSSFCACRPAIVVLTVVRVTPHHVVLAPDATMKGGVDAGPRRCRLHPGGASFDIDLIDEGDQMRRLTRTTVYAWDAIMPDAASDSEDELPLSQWVSAARAAAMRPAAAGRSDP